MKKTPGRPRKLTPLEELALANEKKNGATLTELAYNYGVSVWTVERIVKRQGAQGGQYPARR
ncbi:hypothetical protein [Aminobacterium colombiense]|uniref:hypothetical protein n=1 Tax=Aminobacterium colombiense TaxID=81468 RepID=UPI0025928728|nr:hypothetical protein [uncultured Aminobacterium sp.]